jgi:hypothetical protein
MTDSQTPSVQNSKKPFIIIYYNILYTIFKTLTPYLTLIALILTLFDNLENKSVLSKIAIVFSLLSAILSVYTIAIEINLKHIESAMKKDYGNRSRFEKILTNFDKTKV